jgi:RNA ligase (TIGR02306 family)
MASEHIVEVCRIDEVRSHDKADKLELAVIKGWQVVVPKDKYKAGDIVIYVPPDSILTQELSDRIGVTQYLDKGRVRAIKLRQEPSFGLIMDNMDNLPEGTDVKAKYNIKKYEPPVRHESTGRGAPRERSIKNHPLFHKYSSPQNLRYFTEVFVPGEEVYISEKVHGCNARVGIIDGEWMAGSHEVQRAMPFNLKLEHLKRTSKYKYCKALAVESIKRLGQRVLALFKKRYHKASFTELSRYWMPYTMPEVRALIEDLSKAHKQVILYGELYGKDIQKLDYGIPNGQLAFRTFDLLVDGKYVNWLEFKAQCDAFNVPRVPELYVGPYSLEVIKSHAKGNTTVAGAKHLREGIVVRPVIERTHPKVGRVILKYISDAYLLWKDGKEDADSTDV